MSSDMRRKLPFNAVTLRILALAFMLVDHLWATIAPGGIWMTCVGRLAFPIFAFQAAEGFYHTSDFSKYAKRLLVFGLISEIPFNLMVAGGPVFPFHQNVMFTMLFGILALYFLEEAKAVNTTGAWVKGSLSAAGMVLAGTVLLVDYGGWGVLMVLVFGLLRGFRGAWLCQLAAMVGINFFAMEGLTTPFLGMDFPVQGFAVLALGFIWLYNGEKGPRNRALQYGSYWFYPLHMLGLYLWATVL